ncbi:hypothetical protein F751_2363 [Auxenochlorella protothecoides]|uniref:Uncharacterized protein n=1 Tax=Auxenochlorella protothecoides TaxID=3075 RepID=A0A087SFZ1_AUXPR|nr:hypothetical protein F751_2363 [Auxenochlorella protothecoides]KFM24645.1 hypothetical protein F751_2363 [Auxenochlorella protothecoides]
MPPCSPPSDVHAPPIPPPSPLLRRTRRCSSSWAASGRGRTRAGRPGLRPCSSSRRSWTVRPRRRPSPRLLRAPRQTPRCTSSTW